jgi:hypothetical protein
MLIVILAICGAIGALIDVALHFLQLFTRFEPSLRFTALLTLVGAGLMLASCVFAFNWAALIMALGIAAMSVVSLVTGKEVH